MTFPSLKPIILGLVVATVSLITPAEARTSKLPPNTIDINGGGRSPVIALAPGDIQPQIVPSPRTMISSQVAEFQQMQLTPEEADTIKRIRLDRQRIEATPYVTTPEPIVRSLGVELEPGKTPPLIRVSKNMLTSIVFTDVDGNPWYIEKVALNRNQFSDAVSADTIAADQNGQPSSNPNQPQQAPKPALTNILTLEPNDAIAYGNVSVTLKGKALPVIFLLAAGQNQVDVRVDARVPGTNPDAKPTYIPSPIETMTGIDDAALSFLDGVIPQDAQPMVSSDPAAQAWRFNDYLYVKTRFDVLYPAYTSRASTQNSVNIYRFSATLPNNSITLTQRGGQPFTVSFEEAPYSEYQR